MKERERLVPTPHGQSMCLRVIWNLYVKFQKIFKVQLVDDQPPHELDVEELDVLIINMCLSCKILGCNLGLVEY